MSLVYSKTDTGLVVANHGSDEASVAHALRRYDDDLRLVRQGGDHGHPVWKVYVYRGPDREAAFVLAWQNSQGEPLPLSHALVDAVMAQAKDSRAPRRSEDQLDRQRAEQRQKDWDRDSEALGNDWTAQHGRPVLHRSVSLRMARDKRRARGEKV